MTRAEFDQTIQRVEKAFDREYTDEQVAILWDDCKFWDASVFSKVATSLTRTRERLPSISAWHRAASEIKQAGEFKTAIRKVKGCDECRDGIVYVVCLRDDGVAEYRVARCDCCQSGVQNYPTVVSIDEAKQHPRFARYLTRDEIPASADGPTEPKEPNMFLHNAISKMTYNTDLRDYLLYDRGRGLSVETWRRQKTPDAVPF
jgi:hypothetical protein